MSNSNKKNEKARSFASFLVALIIVATIAAVLYKIGNPTVRQWAGNFGLGVTKSLSGSVWDWQRTELKNGSSILAAGGDYFVLSFGQDGRVTSTTDCNSIFAEFRESDRGQIKIGPISSTEIFCREATLEDEYADQLQRADSFSVSGNVLKLNLKDDSGTMFFLKRR